MREFCWPCVVLACGRSRFLGSPGRARTWPASGGSSSFGQTVEVYAVQCRLGEVLGGCGVCFCTLRYLPDWGVRDRCRHRSGEAERGLSGQGNSRRQSIDGTARLRRIRSSCGGPWLAPGAGCFRAREVLALRGWRWACSHGKRKPVSPFPRVPSSRSPAVRCPSWNGAPSGTGCGSSGFRRLLLRF